MRWEFVNTTHTPPAAQNGAVDFAPLAGGRHLLLTATSKAVTPFAGLGGKAHRQYAQELTKRGFVTLSPSYPLLAAYQPDLKALHMPSGTMKAI